MQGVFYDGQLWDACSLVERLVARAKRLILLIDSWIGTETLDILAKKRKGVVVEVVTSVRGNKVADSEVEKFNAQYGGLSVKTSAAFHDRFIVGDNTVWLCGSSVKDAGRRMSVLVKMTTAPDFVLKALPDIPGERNQ